VIESAAYKLGKLK